MARLVLHMGAYKTGTTYLQNLFHLNRDLLARAGVIYPPTGAGYAQHGLTALWLDVPEAVQAAGAAGGAEALWRDLDRHARGSGTVLLSSELFSHWGARRVDLADLARRLSGFEELRLVYTMRRQAELVQSVWLHQARNIGPRAIHPYVRRAFDKRMASGVRLDHASVYNTLLGHFAPEQIHLVDYHQARAAPGGLAQVFLDLLETGLAAGDLRQPSADQGNISPDPLVYYLASLIAGPDERPPAEMCARIAESLCQGHGPDRPTSLLARYEYVKFRSRFAPGNAELAARVQPVQPGFSFQEADPPADMLFRDDIREHDWARLAAALYRMPPAPNRDRPGRAWTWFRP